MAGPEFFQTGMGHQFYEGTMPTIARALGSIAEQLGKLVAAPAPVEAVEGVVYCTFVGGIHDAEEDCTSKGPAADCHYAVYRGRTVLG